MQRGGVWLVGVGLLILGYFLGRSVGPAPVEFPDAGELRNATQMERAVEAALREPRAFPRAVTLTRLFEGLTSENVVGAARAVDDRAGRWDPIDLQLFLTAWVQIDPLAAVREVESWPIRSRREIGIRIAIREWAANGHWIEAADYFQSIADPDLQGMAAGPLVRGWALAGDLEGALGLAHRLWTTQEKLDVVDGYVRGVLQVEGSEGALDIARRIDPNGHGEFEQRLARVTLNLVGREEPAAAARLYDEFVAESTPAWLGGSLDRLAGLWRNDDPKAALTWLLTLEESPERDRALMETTGTWGIRDFDVAWNWFESERGPFEGTTALDSTDSTLLVGLVRKLARTRPAEAARWVTRIQAGPNQEIMLKRVANFWSQEDPAAADAWIEGLVVAPALRAELRQIAKHARDGASPSSDPADSILPLIDPLIDPLTGTD